LILANKQTKKTQFVYEATTLVHHAKVLFGSHETFLKAWHTLVPMPYSPIYSDGGGKTCITCSRQSYQLFSTLFFLLIQSWHFVEGKN